MEKKTRKLLIIGGIVTTLIGLITTLAIGGYLTYTKWYLPKATKEYIASTEDSYETINEILNDLDSNNSKLHNYDITNKGYEAEEIEDMVASQLETTNEDLNQVNGFIENSPKSINTTSSLDGKLQEYYTKSQTALKEYKTLLEYYEKTVPELKEYETVVDYVMNDLLTEGSISNMEELGKAAQDLTDNADTLKASVEKIKKLNTNDQSEIVNDFLIYTFESTEKYFRDAATAYNQLKKAYNQGNELAFNKALEQVSKADSEFNEALSEIDQKNISNDKELRNYFADQLEDLESMQEEIDVNYLDLKEKYAID